MWSITKGAGLAGTGFTSTGEPSIVGRDSGSTYAVDLAVTAARAADAKMGIDTVVLEMGSLLGVTDAFVITAGANARQVRTLVDEVERQVALAGGRSPNRVEGLSEARWVLMDYGDFIVHVFLDEAREYYSLERLWGNAEKISWKPASASVRGK
ncbi:MAG: ribosome silencing factor [Acidimicrobiales bacterium]